jgi:hypothetical protein
MLIACLSTTKAADAQVLTATAPADSPAGRQFTAWLQAFNSGKRETLRLFIEGHFAKDPVDAPSVGGDRVDQITDQQSQLFAKTRGYDVRKITVSSSSITALAQARWTGHWTALEIYVTAQPPHLIEGFGLRDIEAPVEFLPPERLNSSQIRGKVETLLTSLVAADAFSGTVLVAKSGRPLYAKAYGLASRAWNQPNRIDTRFNVASLSKMFTAVAIAQLVEQGKLSYQDTVGKILPYLSQSESCAGGHSASTAYPYVRLDECRRLDRQDAGITTSGVSFGG